MKQKITALLERELDRLDVISRRAQFDIDAFRQLDLLIRSLKTLSDNLPDDDPASSAQQGASNDDLLAAISDDHSEETQD